jgi:Integrase core domain
LVGILYFQLAQVFEGASNNQNAYIESFNGWFRDECLNEHWFTSLQHARVIVEAWRREYNEERPKKSLGGLKPAAYAKTLTLESVKLTSDPKALCYCKRGGVASADPAVPWSSGRSILQTRNSINLLKIVVMSSREMGHIDIVNKWNCLSNLFSESLNDIIKQYFREKIG